MTAAASPVWGEGADDRHPRRAGSAAQASPDVSKRPRTLGIRRQFRPRVLGLLAFALGALAAAPAVIQGAPFDAEACAKGFEDFDRAAAALGVDPGDARSIPGFPGLATNRVLGAYDPASLNDAQRSAWLQRLVDAGLRRRNLQDSSTTGVTVTADPVPVEVECSALLRQQFPRPEESLAPLAEAAQVRDDYLSWRRFIGVYPLTSLPVRLGVGRLQEETRASFTAPLADLPVEGQLRRYTPLARLEDVPALPAAAIDALGVRLARIPPPVLEALFARHAPVLEIDSSGAFDVPGRPYFNQRGKPGVDSTRLTAYHYASVMPLAGRLRLQLNYVFWFAARPRSGALDTLGGALDGIVWRVTLDEEGRALVYDSIHPCGCYHLFFAGPRLQVREAALRQPEPPLLPQAAPPLNREQRILLRIASRTHYLQRVLSVSIKEQASAGSYALSPYEELYAVDSSAGPVSLFARHGLVPGTGRGERFYLWPMGIRSPGAMRERGRQATAFLGRRHFD
ncbi:MAG: hypothetical protein AAF933_02720, partial [Pseudomonadota bacterium]